MTLADEKAEEWFCAGLPNLSFHVERCTWWYTSLAPPHGAPGRNEEQVGPLRRLQTGSLHFNALAEVGAETVGWRPAAADDDQELVRRIDGVLHVRPLWHNGVRLAPLVVSEVLLQLGVGRDRDRPVADSHVGVERRAARGSHQNESWLASRVTKARRFADAFPGRLQRLEATDSPSELSRHAERLLVSVGEAA